MTDKELLGWAAKAAGYSLEEEYDINGYYWPWCIEIENRWCPLTDDGDALRLVVKLRLTVDRSEVKDAVFVYCDYQDNFVEALEEHGTDPYAATRRAIVRAAAEIGKEMK